MISNKLVNRYAFSLLEIAKEKNLQQEVNANAVEFVEIYCKSRDFILLLKNPVITSHRKFDVMEKVFGDRFCALSIAFIKAVISHKREIILPEIFAEFIRLYKNTLGIVEASIVTAIPVDADFLNKFSEKIKAFSGFPNVEIRNVVDENIIGGFILKFEDKVMDTSVANKLKHIRLKMHS